MMMASTLPLAEQRTLLRRMRLASLLEAATLCLLVFVAVPLKHVFGIAGATAIMGPLHGAAFLYYAWMLVQLLSSTQWSGSAKIRLIVFAFIPLAGFSNERMLRRQEQSMAAIAA